MKQFSKRNKWYLMAAALLMVGVLSFFAVNGTVSADELTPDDPEDVDTGWMPRMWGRGGRHYGYDSEVFWQSISDQSGISVDELQREANEGERLMTVLSDAGFGTEEIAAMIHTAQLAVIDQAVIDGTLTAEEAETIKTRMEERAAAAAERRVLNEALHDYYLAAVSEASGISVDDLQTGLDEGKRMSELLEESMTADEALALRQAAWTAAVEQALADGAITQEQADALQNGPMMGGGMGRGGRGQRGMGMDCGGFLDGDTITEDTRGIGNRFGGGNF